MKISYFHCFSSYRLGGGASPLKMFKNRFNLDIESQFINVLLLAWRSTRLWKIEQFLCSFPFFLQDFRFLFLKTALLRRFRA